VAGRLNAGPLRHVFFQGYGYITQATTI
jgi:hypothetical protein